MSINIVLHPKSGERFIFEETNTPSGKVFRAAGPLYHSEKPIKREMIAWLDNISGYEAYNLGDWLDQEYGDNAIIVDTN